MKIFPITGDGFKKKVALPEESHLKKSDKAELSKQLQSNRAGSVCLAKHRRTRLNEDIGAS